MTVATFFQEMKPDACLYGYTSEEVARHADERHRREGSASRGWTETEHAIVHRLFGADHEHHYTETGALALTIRSEPSPVPGASRPGTRRNRSLG